MASANASMSPRATRRAASRAVVELRQYRPLAARQVVTHAVSAWMSHNVLTSVASVVVIEITVYAAASAGEG
jgi:hypothetical protein